MRIDRDRIVFAANFYMDNILGDDSGFCLSSSETETFSGSDFTIQSCSSGEDLSHVELKTKNCAFNEWSITTTGSCIYFGLVPPIEKDIDKVSRLWTLSKPTQAQISAQKRAEKKSGERVRWFCLNAASGADFSFEPCPKCPKWLGMFKDEKSELLVMFSDGFLYFDHHALLDAQVSYGYLKTWGKEEFLGRSEKYWQFKIFLDIDKGKFIKFDIPKNLLPRSKKYN